MARPVKNGMDYFPLDVSISTEILLIEAKYGLEGFAIIIKLFQKIYGEEGYYCKWDEEVALLFARQNGVKINLINSIVNICIEKKIFNKSMYDKYGILTSEEIQSIYYEAKRKKFTRFIDDYLLINVSKTEVIAAKTEVNAESTEVNVCNNATKESKVNKSKENKSKGEESKGNFSPPTVSDINNYCREQGIIINSEKFVNHFNSKGWLINGSPLIDWKARVMSWYKEDMEKARAAPKAPPGAFNNYEQRFYNEEEINEILKRKMAKER